MRKKTTKLTLNRETINSLTDDTVRKVIAAGSNNLDCTGISICAYCDPWE